MPKNKTKPLSNPPKRKRKPRESPTVKAMTLLVASIQSLQTTIENKRTEVAQYVADRYIEVGDIITDGYKYVEASFRSPEGTNGWRLVCRKSQRLDRKR